MEVWVKEQEGGSGMAFKLSGEGQQTEMCISRDVPSLNPSRYCFVLSYVCASQDTTVLQCHIEVKKAPKNPTLVECVIHTCTGLHCLQVPVSPSNTLGSHRWVSCQNQLQTMPSPTWLS